MVETGGPPVALAGRWLADLGADVWKVEPPEGDPSRRWPPFARSDGRSFCFETWNAGKRSVVATSDEIGRLLAEADVWIDDTLSGDERGPEGVSEAHPQLIVATITPFGRDGPKASHRAGDLVAQAAGGMLAPNGSPDRPPIQGAGLPAWNAAAIAATTGVLLALFERERTGLGQIVETSIQEAVIGSVEHLTARWSEEQRRAPRRGAVHWTGMFRVVPCRDGWVTLSAHGDWTTIREWSGTDDRLPLSWDDDKARRDKAPAILDALADFVADRPAASIGEEAQLLRLPIAPVRSPEALTDDPQLVARGFFAPVDGGRTRLPGPAFRLGATPLAPRGGAPEVGSTTVSHDLPSPARSDLTSADPVSLRNSNPDSSEPVSRKVSIPPEPGSRSGTPGECSTTLANGRVAAPPPNPARDSSSRITKKKPRAAPPDAADRWSAALAGIRVLDFTHVVAGPVATRILADHGAEVVRIEPPRAADLGDRSRGLFSNLNRGKQSVILDLSTTAGLDLARRLVARSDIVIDNFSPRVMENWQLDYEHLRELRPDVVAVSMSGFGRTGPCRDWVSFGPTLQALAGPTWLMCESDGPPVGWGYSWSDMAAGACGALAAVAALFHRRRSGEGQLVDISQFECLAALLGPALTALATDGGAAAPAGNRSQSAPDAPHGVYRARGDDRWIAISVDGDEDWRRLAPVIGEPWAAEPALGSSAGRLERAPEIDAQLERWTRDRNVEDTTRLLQAAGIAAHGVADGHDLCEGDPHLAARGFRCRVDTGGEPAWLDGVVTRLSRTPGRVTAPGPAHGADTRRVLTSVLGIDTEELDRLRTSGAFGSPASGS